MGKHLSRDDSGKRRGVGQRLGRESVAWRACHLGGPGGRGEIEVWPRAARGDVRPRGCEGWKVKM